VRLFKRVVRVAVAPKTEGAGAALAAVEKGLGLDLSALACSFKVKKHLKPEANSCEITLYNLSPASRSILSTPKKLTVRLEAGYEDAVAQLYLGEIRGAQTTREGSDWVTKIETGDSEKEIQSARITLSIGAKVPAGTALVAIARALKVGVGNAEAKANELAARGKVFFGPGTAIYGNAAQELTDFCASADLEWSIQDGVIQILDRGKALESQAALLSSSTGLIGSPTVDHKGVVTFKALIQPDLRPGHKVAFDTVQFKATQGYRIEECDYDGDTEGTSWYVTGKAKKY
jgi:hypothetical protein